MLNSTSNNAGPTVSRCIVLLVVALALAVVSTGPRALADSNLPRLDLTGRWQAIPDKDKTGITVGFGTCLRSGAKARKGREA